MDFVPFTIIFMACLMCFHGNLAAPSICAPQDWPEICSGNSYCFEKTEGYPSAEKIQEMVKKAEIDISKLELPTTTQRSGENVCRIYDEPGELHMIKDARNGIRYVIQDETTLVKMVVEIIECQPEQIDLAPNLECRQNFTTLRLPVTTCDGTGVELIPFVYPSGCIPVEKTDDK